MDSGAQLNLISIGTLFTLARLHRGGQFKAALKGALWNARPGPDKAVTGIGGIRLLVLGYVSLTIKAGGKQIELPFAITREGEDRIIIGTPGLRALGFTMRSPLFKNVDFLADPRNRQVRVKQRDGGAKNKQHAEPDEPRITPAPDQTPTPAPEMEAAKPTNIKGGEPTTKGVRKSAKSGAARITRAASKITQNGPEVALEPAGGTGAGGRNSGKKKPQESVNKAKKSASPTSGSGKCDTELRKEAIYKLFDKSAHVEIDEQGEFVPAEAQVFRPGVKATKPKIKAAQ